MRRPLLRRPLPKRILQLMDPTLTSISTSTLSCLALTVSFASNQVSVFPISISISTLTSTCLALTVSFASNQVLVFLISISTLSCLALTVSFASNQVLVFPISISISISCLALRV